MTITYDVNKRRNAKGLSLVRLGRLSSYLRLRKFQPRVWTNLKPWKHRGVALRGEGLLDGGRHDHERHLLIIRMIITINIIIVIILIIILKVLIILIIIVMIILIVILVMLIVIVTVRVIATAIVTAIAIVVACPSTMQTWRWLLFGDIASAAPLE